MVKDIIKYEGKEYQVSTVLLDYGCYETMIFPIERGIVSGREVYCFSTCKPYPSQTKHGDILVNPQKYVSEEAIQKYIKEKEDWYNS